MPLQFLGIRGGPENADIGDHHLGSRAHDARSRTRATVFQESSGAAEGQSIAGQTVPAFDQAVGLSGALLLPLADRRWR